MRQKILAIQGWRFLFACCVMLAHLNISILGSSLSGAAVSFFLILAGFFSQSLGTVSIKDYYLKKFLRIFPIHWFSLFLLLPLYFVLSKYRTLAFCGRVVLNSMLLEVFVPDSFRQSFAFHATLNGPAWFLSVLVLFYAMFPLWDKLRKCNHKLFYCFVICWSICSYSIACYVGTEWALYFCPFVRVSECLIGMCISLLAQKRTQSTHSLWEYVAIMLFVLSFVLYRCYATIYLSALIWIPAMSVLVFVFSNSSGMASRLMGSQWLVCLGNISMELYMFHWVVKRYWIAVEQFFHVELSKYFFALMVVLTTTFFAFAYNKWLNPLLYINCRK